MNDHLRGLPLNDQMNILANEGLLADGAFGDVAKVTIFEKDNSPKEIKVKPIVVFEAGKTPVTLLIPVD